MTREDASATTNCSISTTLNGDTKSMSMGCPDLGASPTTNNLFVSSQPTIPSNTTGDSTSIPGVGHASAAFSPSSGGEGLMRLADWLSGHGGFGPPPCGGSNNSCCDDPTQQCLIDSDEFSETMTDSPQLTSVAAEFPADLQRKLKKWTTSRHVRETAEELMSKIDTPRQSRFSRSPCAGMDSSQEPIDNFGRNTTPPGGIKRNESRPPSDPFSQKSAPAGGELSSNRQQNHEREQHGLNSREIRHHSPIRRRNQTPGRVPAKRRSASMAPTSDEDPSARYRFADTATANYLSQLMTESRQADLQKMGQEKLPRRHPQPQQELFQQQEESEEPMKRGRSRNSNNHGFQSKTSGGKQVHQPNMNQAFSQQQEDQRYRQQLEFEKQQIQQLKESSSSSFACTSIAVESTGSGSGVENELSKKSSFRFPTTPPKRHQTRPQQGYETSSPGSVDGGGSLFEPRKGDFMESEKGSQRLQEKVHNRGGAEFTKPLENPVSQDFRRPEERIVGGLDAPAPRRKPNFLLKPAMVAKSAALRNLMNRAQNPLLSPPMTALQRRFQAFKETQDPDDKLSNSVQKGGHSDSSRRTSPFPTRPPNNHTSTKYATDFPAYEESPAAAVRKRAATGLNGAAGKPKIRDGQQRYHEMNQQAQALLKPLSQVRESRLQGAGTVTSPRSAAANKASAAFMDNLRASEKLTADGSSHRKHAPAPVFSAQPSFNGIPEGNVPQPVKPLPKRVPVKDPREEMAAPHPGNLMNPDTETTYQFIKRYPTPQLEERIQSSARPSTATVDADMHSGSGDHGGIQSRQINFKGPPLQKKPSPYHVQNLSRPTVVVGQGGFNPQTGSSWQMPTQESLFSVLVREVKRFVVGIASSFWNSLHLDEPLQLSPFSPRYLPPPSNYRPPSGPGFLGSYFSNQQEQQVPHSGQQRPFSAPKLPQQAQPRPYYNQNMRAQRMGEQDYDMAGDSPHEIRYISPNRLGYGGGNPELSLQRPHLATSRVPDRDPTDRATYERGRSSMRGSRTNNADGQRLSRMHSSVSPTQGSVRATEDYQQRRDPSGLNSPQLVRPQYQQRRAVRVPGSSRGIPGQSGDYAKRFQSQPRTTSQQAQPFVNDPVRYSVP